MNAVVHFLVTNLEYQVGHHTGVNQNGILDAYSEAALGELGCWGWISMGGARMWLFVDVLDLECCLGGLSHLGMTRWWSFEMDAMGQNGRLGP